MNNPNGEMERKDPLDNVFHRSMESSMASTAVRPPLALASPGTDPAPSAGNHVLRH